MLCRLIATSSCSRFEGLGCSPMKAVRELGSERKTLIALVGSNVCLVLAYIGETCQLVRQYRGKNFEYEEIKAINRY